MPSEIIAPRPDRLLSVVCAGRNGLFDEWFLPRMALALNKLVENIDTLDVSGKVEIIVADWGSDAQLSNSLELTETSRALIKFLHVPASVSARYDRQTGFSRVHAINCAVRRSSGEYLLVCDDDVYLPLDTMAALLWHLRRGYFHSYSLDNSFFWASKRVIPNAFFSKVPEQKNQPTMPLNPSLNISTTFLSCFPVQEHLDDYIQSHRTSFDQKPVSVDKSYAGSGAALVISKKMWFESRGFDEEVVGGSWGDMEFTQRLLMKYRWDDLNHHGLDFFLLGHWPDNRHLNGPPCSRESSEDHTEPAAFAVNSPGWGLADHDLKFSDGNGRPINPVSGKSESENFRQFDIQSPPQTVRQILAANPLYRSVAERFQYLPLTWFSNQKPLEVLLNSFQPHSVCEIGSYMGASSFFFAAFPSVVEVFCVDHWDRNRVEGYDPEAASQTLYNNFYEQFLANAVHSGTDEKIVPMRLDSRTAAAYCRRNNLRFDLIYIDGDHTTVGARDDVRRWYPMLADGGILCGDDWVWQKEPDNVAGAVISVAREKGWQVFHAGNFWMSMTGGFSIKPLTLEVLLKIGHAKSVAVSKCAFDLREALSASGSGHLPLSREGIPTEAVPGTRPLVSIWTVSHNSAFSIRTCIEGILSVLGEYPDIEFVIQDRASTDGTLRIIEEYAPRFDGRLKLVSERDSGLDDAFWRALKRCKGDYIACCQTDGGMMPYAPALAVSTFSRNPQAAAVFGWLISTDENGATLEIDRGPSEFDTMEIICGESPPHFSGSFFRRKCLEAVGLHQRQWKSGLREFEIWVRLGKRFPMAHIPAAMATHPFRSTSGSAEIQDLKNDAQGRIELVAGFFNDEHIPNEWKELRARAFAGQHVRNAWGYMSLETPSPGEARKEILEALKYQPQPESRFYPSLVNKLYEAGFELCQKNEFEKALEYLKLIDETGNQVTNLHLCTALVLTRLGRYTEARKALERQLAHGSSNSDADDLLKFILF